jgi:chemotaxis protein methyltransferase CheR
MDIDQSKDSIKIKPFLLNKAEFLKHDLVKDKNVFGRKFDFIICRNVLIYFNNNLQNKIFDMFWDNLNEGGFLVIGLHESIMGSTSAKFIKKGQCYIKKSANG